MKKIGIQGSKGSYHEAAANQTFGNDATIVYLHTFHEVFSQLQTGMIDVGIVAIANNSIGFIHETYELITSKNADDFWIVGEIYQRIEHQLLAVPGATREMIKEIHSQAPALGQCSNYLEEHFPHAVLIEQEDTARSAELLALWQDKTKAAIASDIAGELNKLDAIDQNIQDDPDNITRFLIITKRTASDHTEINNKFSAILHTKQTPGSLLRALQVFYDVNSNITTLHSSFIPNSPFEMNFFIEFELKQISLSDIVDTLHTAGCKLDILGSYQASSIPLITYQIP